MKNQHRLKCTPDVSYNADASPVMCLLQAPSSTELQDSNPGTLGQQNRPPCLPTGIRQMGSIETRKQILPSNIMATTKVRILVG